MKTKALLTLALAASLGTVSAGMDLVAIDSNRLLLETQRGKDLQAEIEADAKSVQSRQQELSADLQAQGEALSKQAKVMSPSAQQEAFGSLKLAEARAQRELKGMQEDLQFGAQHKQQTLQRDMLTVATNMLEEQEWGLLVDKATPGVLASAKQLDVTAQVIAKADALYEEEVAAKRVAAAQNSSDDSWTA